MNTLKNGTIAIGAPGSYQRLLSETEDLLKTNDLIASDFLELYHAIKVKGAAIGLSDKRIVNDWETILTVSGYTMPETNDKTKE